MWSNLDKSYAKSSTKKGNPKSAEHIRFEDWLKTRPCQIPGCHRMATESHHEPYLSQGGTHERRIGFCKPHHTDSKIGRHGVSDRDKFNAMYDIDVLQIAWDNWKEFKERHHEPIRSR